MEAFGLGLALLLLIMVLSAARGRPALPPQAPRDFAPRNLGGSALTKGHLLVLAFIIAGLLLLGRTGG